MEGAMLAIAIQNRCDVEIISLLISLGKADVSDFSKDALQVLEEVEEGIWKTEVGQILERKAD